MFLFLFACTAPPSETVAGRTEPPPAPGDTDSVPDTPPADTAPADPWSVTYGPLPSDLIEEMRGTTYHDGCPVSLDELVLLEPAHWDLDGRVQIGRLVVAATAADDLAQVFESLFRAEFPIRGMLPASSFGGSDDASMAADNTSAFNCRAVTGGSGWSQHSYGDAIDINPRENPYISGSLVLPPEGEAYTDRETIQPGMIVEGDDVTDAFDAIGWGWGGRWSSLKDYQHFSSNGQ